MTTKPEPVQGMRVEVVEGGCRGRKGTVTWVGASGALVQVQCDSGDKVVNLSWDSCVVLEPEPTERKPTGETTMATETKPEVGMRVQIITEGPWRDRKGTITWAGYTGSAVDVELDDGGPVRFSWGSCRVLHSDNPPAAHEVQQLRHDAQAWLDAAIRLRSVNLTMQSANEAMTVANRAESEAAKTLKNYVGIGERRRTVVLGDVVVLVALTDDGVAQVYDCKTE